MLHHLSFKFAPTDVDAKGVFSGYGSVFGNVDRAGEIIAKGAFAKSLREWKEDRGKFPPMLYQHGGGMFSGSVDDMTPIGVWDHMEENSKGLKVEGHLIATGTDRGQYILEGLKEGALDGLSILAFIRQSINPTKPGERRTLTDLDLREVSIVTFPANPKARVTAVKNLLTVDLIRAYEAALCDKGYTRRQAATAVSCLKSLPLLRDAELGLPTVSDRDDHDPAQTATLADLIRTARKVRAGMIGAR